MTRSANHTPPSSNGPGLWLTFRPAEWAMLQHNVPGPSGDMGGYQMLENRLRAEAVPPDHRVFLTPVLLERLIRYLNNYKGGGPNGRLRKACPPPLARAGIVLPNLKIPFLDDDKSSETPPAGVAGNCSQRGKSS